MGDVLGKELFEARASRVADQAAAKAHVNDLWQQLVLNRGAEEVGDGTGDLTYSGLRFGGDHLDNLEAIRSGSLDPEVAKLYGPPEGMEE